ncbi:RHS repeat-associated core domain-containing protein [Amycolatopsis sp. NPDC004079]|uniref:RHS repeat-associated core domain-containing protein n=1 Tax=Amycolatopsis sp. NPDC004079 TaxID=3154549 RepID=UPI0033AA9342
MPALRRAFMLGLSALLVLSGSQVPASGAAAPATRAAAALPSNPVDYSYDAAGQLKGVAQTGADGAAGRYNYDASGNLTSIDRYASSTVSITSLVPAHAPAGATVTVSGTGFAASAAGNTVSFNGKAAAVTAASATSLVVTVPTGATSGAVTVATPSGSAGSQQAFTVDAAAAAPVVTGFSPAVLTGGSTLTISGSGFDPAVANDVVSVGSVRAKAKTATATSLTVELPDYAAPGPVTVETPGGAGTSTDDVIVAPSGFAASAVATTPRLAVDGAATVVTIPAVGKIALLRFAGKKDQRLTLGLTGSTFPTDFGVGAFTPYGGKFARAPYDQFWAFSQLHGGYELPPLPSTGIYQIALTPPANGSGSVTATLSSRVAGALSTTGAGTPVTLAKPGQQAELSFPATAGQHLDLGFSGSTFAAGTLATASIREPHGVALQWSPGSTRGQIRLDGNGNFDFTAAETGTYSVVFGSSDQSTGSITVTASVALEAGAITAGADKTVQIDRPGQDARLTYAGTAGTALSLDLTGYGFAYLPFLTVTAPDGSVLTSGIVADYHWEVPALPTTGTYTITVDPYSSAGAFSLRLTTIQPAGALSATGDATTISLPQPGRTAVSSFPATAGQTVSVAFSGWTFPAAASLWVQVIGPDGKVAVRATDIGSLSSFFFTPTATGAYRLQFSLNDATSTGAATVTLSNEQAGGALAVGATKQVGAARAGQGTRFTVAGTAGQHLSLDFAAPTFAHTFRVQVVKPDNTVLRDGNLTETQVDLDPLPATGTYQIVVYPYAETGATQLTLEQRVDAGAITAGGAAKTLAMAQRAQLGETGFTAVGGQRLDLGLTGSTFPAGTVLRVRVLGPTGAAIIDDRVDPGGEIIIVPATAGNHRIIVTPDGFATGSVTATLSEPIDAGTLQLNTAKNLSFPRAGQENQLHYNGTAGQRLSLNTTGGTVPYYPYYQVSKPDGTVLASGQGGASISLPALPVTGSYEIILGPYSNTGTATVVLVPAAASARSSAQPRALAPPAVAPSPGPGAALQLSNADAMPPRAPGVPSGFQQPAPSAQAGAQTWTPDKANLAGKDWTTHRAAVAAEQPAALSASPGTTALSGRVRTLDGRGLPGVTVSIDGTHATTDAAGRFLLAGIGAGHRVLRVDGATASGPKASFGLYDIGVDAAAGRTTALPYPIWLTALDAAHTVEFASPTPSEVVVTNPAIPGLEVHLPAGAVVRDVAGKPVTRLGITAIPIDRPPFPLPNSHVPVYFTVQPGSAYVFPTGARVVYPNYTNASPGTVMDFWHYDPAGRGWFVYGHGKVTADRKQVVPDAGTEVYQFTGAMLIEPGTAPPPPVASKPGGVVSAADPVDLATGLLTGSHTDLAVNDTLPLAINRTYQQGDTAQRTFGVGGDFDYNMYLYSDQQWIDGQLILPDGGRVRYHRITPGGTGSTDFLDAVFAADPTPTKFAGSVLAWNGNGFDVRLRDGTTYVFGEEAPLQAIRDKFGNTITVHRAAAAADPDGIVRAKGRITQVTSPSGKWFGLSYDSDHELALVSDNTGRAVTYDYDTSGHLTQFADAGNNVTTYTYDPQGRLATSKDARGTVYSANTYDANGRVTKQTNADGTFFTIDYTTGAAGNVTETRLTDPRGTVRRLTFNAAGFTTSDTAAFGTPLAQTTTITRDPTSNAVTSTTDALNRRTDFGRDPYGNLTSLTQLAGTSGARTATFTRDGSFDQISRSTDWQNNATVYGYLPNGALHTVTDPTARTTTIDSLENGQVSKVADNLGHATVYGYTLGEPTSSTDQLGRTTRQTLDATGRVTGSRDPTGSATTIAYDALDRIASVTDPLGRTTAYGYDPNGNLHTVTDPRQHTTTYDYDPLDRVTSHTDPLNRKTTYGYDPGGNLATTTDARGTTTAIDHDALDRTSAVRYGVTQAGAESQTGYGYDAGNRLTSAADSIAGTTTFSPNDLDQLAQTTTPQGQISYTYDPAGRRKTMTAAGQPQISYGYDNAGRPTSIAQGSTQTAISYDGAGRRSTVTLPDGIVETYGYDNAGQLASIGYTRGTTTLGDLAYTYDNAGRPIHVGGSYARAAIPAAYGPAAYDNANQLTDLAGTARTYDNAGNLTADGATSYTWNARGQLTASATAGQTTAYAYDGLGRRIGKTAAGTTKNYLYDGLDPAAELSGATVTATTLTGGLDQVYARTTGGTTQSLLTDRLGSTLAVADTNGAVTGEYTYQPFGATTLTGTDNANPTRFAGRDDDGTGLYHNRARYYSPGDQRFLSQDPLGFAGGDSNLYAYVTNQPTNLTDPLGAKPQALFRGTTRGYPGSEGTQRVGVTPTSTDPGVAATFATHSQQFGEAVVQIALPGDLAGVATYEGYIASEFEVGVDLAPNEFARRISAEIPAADARGLLRDLGIAVPASVSISEISPTLEAMPKLSAAQIQQFVEGALKLGR